MFGSTVSPLVLSSYAMGRTRRWLRMRIAKITFIMIAALAVAALPAGAQLGANVGGATSAAGHVAGGGQNVGAGLGSTADTTVGTTTGGLHKTTDGVSD